MPPRKRLSDGSAAVPGNEEIIDYTALEQEAIVNAENRIAEAEEQGGWKERYEHLRNAHREQAKQAVVVEKKLREAIDQRNEAGDANEQVKADLLAEREQMTGAYQALVRELMVREQTISDQRDMIGRLVAIMGGGVLIPQQLLDQPGYLIASWEDPQGLRIYAEQLPDLGIPVDDWESEDED